MNARPAIGFVGLGTMGRPMAYRLLAAGFGLTVYDVNPAAADALCGKGAVRAGGLEDLGAGSDVVMVAVVNDAQVRHVVGGVGQRGIPLYAQVEA